MDIPGAVREPVAEVVCRKHQAIGAVLSVVHRDVIVVAEDAAIRAPGHPRTVLRCAVWLF
jgi:hypothetical protein